jgi:hypothetical protein
MMRRLQAVARRLEQAHAVKRETPCRSRDAMLGAGAGASHGRRGVARLCRLGLTLRHPDPAARVVDPELLWLSRGAGSVASAQERFSLKLTHTLL